MSFTILKSAINCRFAEVVSHLNYITTLEPKDSFAETSIETKMFRGFFYVHMYAVLERIVNDLVATLIDGIKLHSPKNSHLLHSLNSISQARSWQSLRDSRHSDLCLKAVCILENIDSENIFELEATYILKNLANIWASTIDDLLRLFGISSISITPTDRTLIDEIVEKRNAVAHGRESPVSVGERFRCDALRVKLSKLQLFCNNLVLHVENYYQGFGFIRSGNRTEYSSAT